MKKFELSLDKVTMSEEKDWIVFRFKTEIRSTAELAQAAKLYAIAAAMHIYPDQTPSTVMVDKKSGAQHDRQVIMSAKKNPSLTNIVIANNLKADAARRQAESEAAAAARKETEAAEAERARKIYLTKGKSVMKDINALFA